MRLSCKKSLPFHNRLENVTEARLTFLMKYELPHQFFKKQGLKEAKTYYYKKAYNHRFNLASLII